ncbi:MAG: TonB-dependent receptor [Pseudomonadota bacterium]
MAQSAADPDQVTSSNDHGLADIVVTAQRKSENLQSAPIAIAAVSGDEILSANVTDPAGLTKLVPSLQVAKLAGAYALFYLRGVGNFNSNSLSDSAIAFNFNDVYVGRPSATSGFLYDVGRVEVLKGPQGTLYGRNATGGAINVLPNAPSLGEVGGYMNAGYGNFNAVSLEGAINAPIGEKAAIRAAASYNKHDGYLSDGTSDQDDFAARLSLLTEPSQDLSIKIVADYSQQKGRGLGGVITADPRLNPDDRIGLGDPRSQAFYAANVFVFPAGTTLAGLVNNTYIDNNFWGISGTVKLELGSVGNLTVIPAYRASDIEYRSNTPGFGLFTKEHSHQFSFEARLASDDSAKLGYLLGAFYYDDKNRTPALHTNVQFNATFQDYSNATRSTAVFGRLSYKIAPDVTATVGGRYTDEQKTFAGTFVSATRLCFLDVAPAPPAPPAPPFGLCPGAQGIPQLASAPPTVIGGGIGGPVAFFPAFGTTQLQLPAVITPNRKLSGNKFTWRAGLDWKVTPDNLLYASYETGFKTGGFYFSGDQGTYNPETLQAWTLGSKNSFADKRIRLNLELFYWKYRDQQIGHLSTDSLGNTIFAVENVGRARFKGFEIEAQALVTPTTKIGANIQYLDANYDSFVYSGPIAAPPQTGCGTTVSPSLGRIFVDCSGKRPPNAPEWTINLTAEQAIALPGGNELVFGARGNYQSETLTALEFIAGEVQKAFWLADASATFNAKDDAFYVTAYVNNLFDTTVMSNAFPPPLTNGLIVGSYRPPRTYGIRAGIKF